MASEGVIVFIAAMKQTICDEKERVWRATTIITAENRSRLVYGCLLQNFAALAFTLEKPKPVFGMVADAYKLSHPPNIRLPGGGGISLTDWRDDDVQNAEGGIHAQSKELAVKTKIHVETLARELNAALPMPLDVTRDAEVEAVFERVRAEWGRLDVLVHSLGWAPK